MPKKRTQGPKDPNKPTYQCDAGDCGFTTQWRIAIINHKRMKHGQVTGSASEAPPGQGPSAPAPVPRPPAQAVDEPLDMRAKLRQVLTRAGVTQKLEAIATIMDDDPENPEHFWVTLSDARVPKLEKQLAFRLWFERSPQQVVDDGDMEEEVLDYKPGMELRRGSDDDDDFDDEDVDDSFIGTQARMMKRQFRMEQMNLQLEQMRQTRRQLREDAALDRRERMMALGLTQVNPQTGQPMAGAPVPESLIDYFYTPTGQMLRVTPSQMMAYERMRIEQESAKRSTQPDPAQVRKQRSLPDGTMVSATDEEYNGMVMAVNTREAKLKEQQGTEAQRRAEADRLQQAANDQRAAFERQITEMQRRHDEAQRQYQDRIAQILNDQKTSKLEEEIKRTQQYVAGQANRDRVDEMVQTQKKLKDAGLTSSSAEEQKLGLEIQKVSKGLDMVGKRLDNVGNKTDKALDTFTEIVKAKAQRDMAAEHGPPAAQEEYEYGDASEPPPEEPKGSGEGGSEESGDDGGESGEEHESNLMS